MKKTKTIATKILLSVFGVVLVASAVSFGAGYIIVKNNNESTFREENKKIVENINIYFDLGLLEAYFDKTYTTYEANAPENAFSTYSEEYQSEYYEKFKYISSYVDPDDNINYYKFLKNIFVGSALSSGVDALNVGFIDAKRNRFVCLYSYQDIKTVNESYEWPSLGSYFTLPSVLKDRGDGSTSYDGEKYNRYGTDLFGSGQKLETIQNENAWTILDQKMSVVESDLNHFTAYYAIIVSSLTFILLIALYFLIRHFAISPTRKLSAKAEEYTGSLKQGDIKNIFKKSNGRPDEIMTLNDSFYFLSEELEQYVKKIKEAATVSEKMQAELELAKNIQLSSLPKGFIHDIDISIYALMEPAKEVGGDLYAFEDNGKGKLYFFIGDVSGKGIPASLFMMQAKTLLQETLSDIGLLDAIEKTNSRLLEEDSEDLFLTAFIAVFDKKTGVLQYINAGHEPIFVYRDGTYEMLKEIADVPLATLPGFKFHLQNLTLHPGDRIFAYTDGVSESMSKEGKLYGKDKIGKTLNSLAGAEDKEVIEGMKESLRNHSAGTEQYDDICMLSFSYIGGQELIVKEESDLSKIPEFVESRLSPYLPKNDISSVDVILDELVSNSLFYGGIKEDPISLLLRYDEKEGAVGLIRDHGKAFDPLHEAPKRKEGQIGGMGITISKSLASTLIYKRVGSSNILKFTKKKSK